MAQWERQEDRETKIDLGGSRAHTPSTLISRPLPDFNGTSEVLNIKVGHEAFPSGSQEEHEKENAEETSTVP